MVKANQDIRDYMADHCVTQRDIAAEVGVSVFTINKRLQTEMSQQEKEQYLNMIDSIAADRAGSTNDDIIEEKLVLILNEDEDEAAPTEDEVTEDVSCSTKFQIGDRVIIPSKANKVGIVSDIWSSLAKQSVMYAVENETDGYCGMYNEFQLKLEPLPIDYSFEAHIDGNVAVVTMNATQGEKTWVYARGHAHIIHDGAVGMAQAISYAARRMFEVLDKKQDKQIYFK